MSLLNGFTSCMTLQGSTPRIQAVRRRDKPHALGTKSRALFERRDRPEEPALARHNQNWAAAARELCRGRANLNRLAMRLGLK
jgi:transcriptional regulator with GAF, ATPase, and Fis domain